MDTILSFFEDRGTFDSFSAESREALAAYWADAIRVRRDATRRTESFTFDALNAQNAYSGHPLEVVLVAGDNGISAIGPEAAAYAAEFIAYVNAHEAA